MSNQIDPTILESALTKRINFWMSPESNGHVASHVLTALVDVRQCVREAAGIDKPLNED